MSTVCEKLTLVQGKKERIHFIENIVKPTVDAVAINLFYLHDKRNEIGVLLNKVIKNIRGLSYKQTKLLVNKLDKIKNILKENGWQDIYKSIFIQLTNKIRKAALKEDRLKINLIESYINGIMSMIQVLELVISQIDVIKIHDNIRKLQFRSMIVDINKFIRVQVTGVHFVRKILIDLESTYFYIVRMRLINKYDQIINELDCKGFKQYPMLTKLAEEPLLNILTARYENSPLYEKNNITVKLNHCPSSIVLSKECSHFSFNYPELFEEQI